MEHYQRILFHVYIYGGKKDAHGYTDRRDIKQKAPRTVSFRGVRLIGQTGARLS